MYAIFFQKSFFKHTEVAVKDLSGGFFARVSRLTTTFCVHLSSKNVRDTQIWAILYFFTIQIEQIFVLNCLALVWIKKTQKKQLSVERDKKTAWIL